MKFPTNLNVLIFTFSITAFFLGNAKADDLIVAGLDAENSAASLKADDMAAVLKKEGQINRQIAKVKDAIFNAETQMNYSTDRITYRNQDGTLMTSQEINAYEKNRLDSWDKELTLKKQELVVLQNEKAKLPKTNEVKALRKKINALIDKADELDFNAQSSDWGANMTAARQKEIFDSMTKSAEEKRAQATMLRAEVEKLLKSKVSSSKSMIPKSGVMAVAVVAATVLPSIEQAATAAETGGAVIDSKNFAKKATDPFHPNLHGENVVIAQPATDHFHPNLDGDMDLTKPAVDPFHPNLKGATVTLGGKKDSGIPTNEDGMPSAGAGDIFDSAQ